MVQTSFPISRPRRDHLPDHLVVLGHRMPGHISSLGDGAVIYLVGVNFHVLPDLPLLLGEFLR